MKKGFFLIFAFIATSVWGVQNNNSTLTTFSDLLIWQVREGSADNWAQIIPPVGVSRQIQILDVPFESDPGYRLGIGYKNQNKFWDALIYFTYFKTRGTSSTQVNSGGIYSSFLGNFFVNNTSGALLSGPYYTSAGIQWDLTFNNLDLEIGHTFKLKQLLDLHPFVGIKAAVINQDINTNWQNPFDPNTFTPITTFTSANEEIINNFWGIGPSVGLNTNWYFYQNPNQSLSLVGNFSGAVLLGHWELTDTYKNNAPTKISIINDSLNTASSMARMYMGIEWKREFSKTNLALRIGYEGQVWLNQMRYYSFNMGRLNNPLSLQGGVLGFCINF